MTEIIVSWLQNLISNEYLLLFVLSIVPLTEMRGAIVLSGGMNINHIIAFFACVGGSSLVVLPLLALFRPIMKWLRMTRLFKPLADMIESLVKTRAEVFKDSNKKKGNGAYWILYFFVAIPLPLTGVWMAAMIAAFIGLKTMKSAFAIIAGNITAALILTLLIWLAKDYVDIILLIFLAIFGFSALLISARKWQKKTKEKEAIELAEITVPKDEQPFIGEFAAGGKEEIFSELLDEDNDN